MLPAILLLASARLARAEDAPGFDVFWREFRDAMRAGEVNRLARMTFFPLTSRGKLAAEPLRRHNQVEFTALMRGLRLTEGGTRAAADLRLLFASRLSLEDERRLVRVQGNRAFAGPLEFQFMPRDGWRFVQFVRQD